LLDVRKLLRKLTTEVTENTEEKTERKTIFEKIGTSLSPLCELCALCGARTMIRILLLPRCIR